MQAKNFCFGIFHPARPSYFIHARDDNEMMDWVRAIRRDDNKVGLIDFETLTCDLAHRCFDSRISIML